MKTKKEVIEFINADNLIWCRKKAGLRIPDVYKKTGWSSATQKIEKWESREDFPTIAELKKLGKLYKKAWTLFLLEKEIKDLGFSIMKDFRGSFERADEKQKYEIINFVNEMERRQEFLVEFSGALEIEPNVSFGSLVDSDNPGFVAQFIVDNLQINFEDFYKEKTRRDALNFLQTELGKNNILISFSSLHSKKQISLDYMRGVLLRSRIAPVIGINSGDKSLGAQMFTIFHELAHLFTEPISDEPLIETISLRDTSKKSPKERFCDEVAARILVPDGILQSLRDSRITPEIVEKYCKLLKINREPFLYRSRNFGLISKSELDALMNASIKDIDTPDLFPKGTPDGGLLHLLKNGKSFAKYVGGLYVDGAITYSQALGALDIKSTTFNRFVVK